MDIRETEKGWVIETPEGLKGVTRQTAPTRQDAEAYFSERFNMPSPPASDRAMNTTTGAPPNVRYSVGGAPGPMSRLQTMQRYYPDAQPYGTDNFTYTNPQTGQTMLYNPPGFDFGDLPSIAPEIAEFAGGVLGGAGATALTRNPVGVAAGVGAGAATGKEIENLVARMVTERQDARNAPQAAVDTAFTFGVNAAGQGISDALLAVGKAVVRPLVRRRFVGGNAQEVYDATRRVMGEDPPVTAGQATGSADISKVEGFLQDTLGGAGVMQSVRDAQEAAVDRFVESMIDDVTRASGGNIGAMTPAEFGAMMKREAANRMALFSSNAENVYSRFLYRYLPKNAEIDTPNAVAFLGDLRNVAGGNAAAADYLSAQFRSYANIFNEAAESGQPLSLEALMSIRSDVGDIIGRGGRGADRNLGDFKRFYAAITRDIEEAAAQRGADALKGWQKVNRYYEFNQNANIAFLNAIEKAGTPEAVFKMLSSGTKEGANLLYKTRRNMRPDQYDAFVGTIIDRMGRATASRQGASGALEEANIFSAETFLTNYSKLSKEAKTALFSGERYTQTRRALDDLTTVLASGRQYRNAAGNPSGTGQRVIVLEQAGLLAALGYGLYTGDQGSAGAAAAAVVSPRVAAKLMTSPRFVRWLSTGMQIRPNTNNWARHLGRLGSIAYANEELKPYIENYRQALGVDQGEGNR